MENEKITDDDLLNSWSEVNGMFKFEGQWIRYRVLVSLARNFSMILN
jgi:hypothetical protein